MQSGSPISLLMFGTLIIVLIVVAVLFARHMRKPGNRHPMDGKRERNVAADLDRDNPA